MLAESGKIAYHAACHLRAQKIGTPGARLLGLVPDTEVEIVEKCSAVDGTWGMKAQHYEMGRTYAQKLVRGIESATPALVVTAFEALRPRAGLTDSPTRTDRSPRSTCQLASFNVTTA